MTQRKEDLLNPHSQLPKGLNEDEVAKQRELYGSNHIARKRSLLITQMFSTFMEPMFLLLLAACTIYFVLSQYAEAFTMLAALLFVSGIDVFQNFRSRKAINALSRITKSKARVVRQFGTVDLEVEEVVKEDILICEEGMVIPADAVILSSNDFSVNEAILTGESVAVDKNEGDRIMQGTQVVRGYSYAQVVSVGSQTVLSGIGQLVEATGKEKTPLQQKVTRFVRVMVIAGGVAFFFVWIYYWLQSGDFITGLLHGLTMAMSVLPEEIPVALSTFMALGAYRLLKQGIIARNPRAVETLGSATVICLDKTGTLTKNLMEVAQTYNFQTKKEIDFFTNPEMSEVLEYAMWASEVSPFDPMEQSIHRHYGQWSNHDQRVNYHMVKEFPLAGMPPVMTHIYQDGEKNFLISCKGSVEGILNRSSLSKEEKEEVIKIGNAYATKGLRVLGVSKGIWTKKDLPESQEEIPFEFLGLITFHDPPDPEIAGVIQQFYDAGVSVKMITGDYKETAVAIAALTGIKTDGVLTGKEIEALSDNALENESVKQSIFARVSPESKLRIIEALKRSGEVVAMTGDGVNDAPALQSAHIGIAMGKRGTEVAKGAAGLVLANDNLAKMVDAIFLGRRINENLIKAIRYIISIHIPIILLVLLPIGVAWLPVMLFTPVHVIFLELLMGPTCSIVYENEPVPKSELLKPVHGGSRNLLSANQLYISLLQGVMITLSCMAAGYYGYRMGLDDVKIRSLIFSTLILSNIFLTLINRSFVTTIFNTIKRKNKLIPIVLGASVVFLILILQLPALNQIFDVFPLTGKEIAVCIALAILGTFWIEPFKHGQLIEKPIFKE